MANHSGERLSPASAWPALATAGHELSQVTSLDVPLRSLCTRAPVRARPDESIRSVVARMHEQAVGSVLIVSAAGRPVGIFTLYDLRRAVAAGGALDTAVMSAMTPDPHVLDADVLAFEAVIVMAHHRIRHLPVMAGGVPVGVVSERDLFARQRVNVVHIMRTLAGADDVARVAAIRAAIPPLIDALLDQGAGAPQITRILTLLNDHTVARVIELCTRAQGAPVPPFTWLAFGSEGRGEQALHTDQDNGLLFDPGDERPEAVREQLLPLARAINDALAQCGFRLCPGNVMAGNPALCLSAEEWRALFSRMIASTTPENILRSSIYFDLRPVRGDAAGVAELRAHMRAEATANTLFLRSLAANALSHRPALGRLRTFATERVTGVAGASFDMKMRGLFPFVEGARVLALTAGIEATGTGPRLRALPAADLASAEDAGAWESAFGYLQLLRLRAHQRQARAGDSFHNRLVPARLNVLKRRVLREALQQGRALQRRLAVRFQL